MENEGEHLHVIVTNLDPMLEVPEMIKSLLSSFSQYVNVLYLAVSLQSGVLTKAILLVPSFREAEYALFELQGEYIGRKRMSVSFVPAEKDAFENKRSCTPIVTSALHDFNIISIPEKNDDGYFLVYLNPDYYTSFNEETTKDQILQAERQLSLSKHLQLLANDMTLLLQDHGEIPLDSFDDLFEQKFGIPVCSDIYNFPDLRSLIEYFNEYFLIRSHQQTWAVCLNSRNEPPEME